MCENRDTSRVIIYPEVKLYKISQNLTRCFSPFTFPENSCSRTLIRLERSCSKTFRIEPNITMKSVLRKNKNIDGGLRGR